MIRISKYIVIIIVTYYFQSTKWKLAVFSISGPIKKRTYFLETLNVNIFKNRFNFQRDTSSQPEHIHRKNAGMIKTLLYFKMIIW